MQEFKLSNLKLVHMETRFYGVLENVRFAETGKYPSLLELSRQQVFR